jgi:hypothetical protein
VHLAISEGYGLSEESRRKQKLKYSGKGDAEIALIKNNRNRIEKK